MRAAPSGTNGRQIAKNSRAVATPRFALIPSRSSGTKRNTNTNAVRLMASDRHM